MATAATDVKKILAFQQRERKVLKMVEPLVALSNAWVLSSMLEMSCGLWSCLRRTFSV